MLQSIVEIKKIKKIYTSGGGLFNSIARNVHAVDNIDLQIHKGETLGLVGESGCGKSTLARVIIRLEKPDAGYIYYKGDNINSFSADELKSYRCNVQMIFQDPYSSLNPRKSAISIIREPLTIRKVGDKNERDEMAMQLMAKVGLTKEQANRYPHEFSGGQRQRIGIARALVLKPELIIADEPVSALDVSVQAQILNLLKELKHDFGLTYLFISHDLNVIRNMSDRVAVMYLGKIVELAANRDIYSSPLHPYTRMLLSAVPSCDPKNKNRIVSIKGEARNEGEKGCNFQNRCSYKIEICAQEEPPLKRYDQQRFCACHRGGSI
jgi:oligopeptide transport system ATP-binding protein